MRRWPQNEDDLKIEDDLRNEDDLKNEGDLRNEDNLKNEEDLKNKDNLKNEKKIAPSPPLKKLPDFFFLMTSPHNSHTTTDVKPETIPGV